MQRREFLKTGAVLAGGLAISRGRALAAPVGARVEVMVNEPLGTIAPGVYGHFTEHLGGTIYDGVWVGTKSKIANTNGIRTALVEKMKQIKAPAIRWPGGCFADSYDWRDGIGPRDKRPSRTNFWADNLTPQQMSSNPVQAFDDNAFGTDEFINFCKLSGSSPYLAANLRSLPALEFDHWVEYCNSPAGSTTLAKQRAAGGSAAPYNVQYWGVGNESWGCGGAFEPEDYASEYRRFTDWVPRFGQDLRFIGSGPNDDEVNWTHRFFQKLFGGTKYYDRRNIWGFSVHHYAWNMSRGKTNDWVAGKGDALQFDNAGYYECLRESDKVEGIMLDHWSAMAEYDPMHRVKLVVDEYGPWYRPGTELDPTHLLGQQITMRDAVVTAASLDVFNRHPEKVGMAACAQLINCLNALFFAHEDKFIVTPVFHVFDLYKEHQGATALRAEFSAPAAQYDRDGKPASFWSVKGSASVKGKTVTLTLVNADSAASRETELVFSGASIASAKAVTLANADVHAHNTFAQPDVVGTAKLAVRIAAPGAVVVLPPASVTCVTVELV